VVENFRRVAVRKEIVGFEVFVDFDELQIAPGVFASAAGAGFAIANDILIRRDPASFGERAKREDNARGVAAGIGNKAGVGNFLGIELGKAVGRFAKVISMRSGQLVPGSERFRSAKAESSAQIHNAQAGFEKSGRKLRGDFVRSGQKSRSRGRRSDRVDRKRPKWSLSPSAKLRKEFGDTVGATRFPDIKRDGSDGRMPQKNARKLEARVSGDTNDSDLARISHFTSASIFFWRESRVFLLGVMMRTVSSPAMVPAISGNFEASTAAARG